MLVRHVARALPSPQNKIVVCVDDLGRARAAAWAEARDRLTELAGVEIMAAARREDPDPYPVPWCGAGGRSTDAERG